MSVPRDDQEPVDHVARGQLVWTGAGLFIGLAIAAGLSGNAFEWVLPGVLLLASNASIIAVLQWRRRRKPAVASRLKRPTSPRGWAFLLAATEAVVGLTQYAGGDHALATGILVVAAGTAALAAVARVAKR